MAQEPAADGEGEDEGTRQTEPAYLPDPQMEPAKPKPTPKTDTKKGRDPLDGDSQKLQGTITLDVDPTTGLIAVDSCPVIRTKTFIIGQEPKKYCGPEYHKKTSSTTSPTARRAATSPPRRRR